MAITADRANQLDPALILGFTNLADARERQPLRIARGQGVFVFDDSGKDYIEGASSFYCTALGYSEEALIEAAVDQMRALPFYVSAASRTVPVVERLAERLAALVPMEGAKVAFAATGSEANDALVKFLWFHNNASGLPKAKKIVARLDSYHGGTVATASLTGWTKYHAGFDLPIAGMLHARQPDYRKLGEPGEGEIAFADRMVAELRQLIEAEGPETIGAFLAEPVSVSAGLAMPPDTYWPKLCRLLADYRIRLFDDEVVTGFGRTGAMFGAETFAMTPDCMSLAKALSSAYQPISAVVMSGEFYEGLERGSTRDGMFSHAGTYHGHPVPAAVALRVLELFEERDILSHVRRVMGPFAAGLRRMAEHPLVATHRAVGLAGAVDLERPHDAVEEGALGAHLSARCQANGLFIRAAGDTAVLAPPLIITESEIDELFRRFHLALDETFEVSGAG